MMAIKPSPLPPPLPHPEHWTACRICPRATQGALAIVLIIRGITVTPPAEPANGSQVFVRGSVSSSLKWGSHYLPLRTVSGFISLTYIILIERERGDHHPHFRDATQRLRYLTEAITCPPDSKHLGLWKRNSLKSGA